MGDGFSQIILSCTKITCKCFIVSRRYSTFRDLRRTALWSPAQGSNDSAVSQIPWLQDSRSWKGIPGLGPDMNMVLYCTCGSTLITVLLIARSRSVMYDTDQEQT